MNTTTPAAINAAKQAVSAARLSEAAARLEHDKAAARFREAENRLELARDGAKGSPEAAAMIEQAEVALREAYDTYDATKNAVAVAAADVGAAQSRLEHIERLPIAVPPPNAVALDELLREAFAAMESAREARAKATTARDEIKERLESLEEKRLSTLSTRTNVEKKGAELAAINGQKEILENALPDAEADLSAAIEVHAVAVRQVQGLINSQSFELFAAVRVALAGLRESVAKAPVETMVGDLWSAKERCGITAEPVAFTAHGEQYAAAWISLAPLIEEQVERINGLAEDIRARLAEMNPEPVEGGKAA